MWFKVFKSTTQLTNISSFSAIMVVVVVGLMVGLIVVCAITGHGGCGCGVSSLAEVVAVVVMGVHDHL